MAYVLILLWNLATLVPIWLGWWDVFAVLGLYWFENLCTGIVQFRKLRDAEAHADSPREAFALSSFFALHYGIFTAVHGLLVLVFFGLVMGGLWQQGQAWSLSALVIAAIHSWGYRGDWRASQGWTRTTPGRLMAEPYARVLVLHAIVIGGGWLALSAQSPQTILKLFGLIKLGVELTAAFLWRRFATKAGS